MDEGRRVSDAEIDVVGHRIPVRVRHGAPVEARPTVDPGRAVGRRRVRGRLRGMIGRGPGREAPERAGRLGTILVPGHDPPAIGGHVREVAGRIEARRRALAAEDGRIAGPEIDLVGHIVAIGIVALVPGEHDRRRHSRQTRPRMGTGRRRGRIVLGPGRKAPEGTARATAAGVAGLDAPEVSRVVVDAVRRIEARERGRTRQRRGIERAEVHVVDDRVALGISARLPGERSAGIHPDCARGRLR